MSTQGVSLPLIWLFLPSSRSHYCTSESFTWTAISLVDSIYVLMLYILLGIYTVRIVRCVYNTRQTKRSRSKKRNEPQERNSNYTARDNVKLITHGYLRLRVFGFNKWVFVHMILKFIAFLTKSIA